MPEVTDYLKRVASESIIAEERLKDAEESLHTVVEKLEDFLGLIIELRQYEPFLYDTLWFDTRELNLVSVCLR